MGNHTVANMEMEISYYNEFLYFCHKVFDVSDIQQRTMSRKILLRNYSFFHKKYVLVYVYFRTFNITRKHYVAFSQQLCYIRRCPTIQKSYHKFNRNIWTSTYLHKSLIHTLSIFNFIICRSKFL